MTEEERQRIAMQAQALGATAAEPKLTQQGYVDQVVPARSEENILLGTESNNNKADKMAFDKVESYRPSGTGWKGRRASKKFEEERPAALEHYRQLYRTEINASDTLRRSDNRQTKVNDANAYYLKNFGPDASSGDLSVSNNNIKGRETASTVKNKRLVQAVELANKRGKMNTGLENTLKMLGNEQTQGFNVINTEQDFQNQGYRDATLNANDQVNTAIDQENAIERQDLKQIDSMATQAQGQANTEINAGKGFTRDVTKLFIKADTAEDVATTAHLRDLGKIDSERNFNAKIAGDRGQLWTLQGKPIQFQINAEGYPVNPDDRERINLSGLYNSRPTIEMKAAKGREKMVTAFDDLVKNYIELADKDYATNTNNNVISNMWDSFNNANPAIGQALGSDRKRLLEVTDAGRQNFMDSMRAGQEIGARLMDTPIEVQRMMRPLGDVNNTAQGNLQIMQMLGKRNNLPSETIDAAVDKYRSEDEPELSEHDALLQERERRRKQ